MTPEARGHLEVEDRRAVLIVRVDGGPHGVFGAEIADQLEDLVDRVDRDPDVHAVVFTGAHPERFVSHAEVRWLQEGGAAVPPVGPRGASAVARTARSVDRARVLEPVVRRTPLWSAVQLERLHVTFLRMNRSGTIFVAALNGSALGLGAEFACGGGLEFALACGLIVADETVRLGCPEVRLGLIPGAGGTQRLVTLLGRFRAAELIMTGRLLSAAEAAELGLVTRVTKAGTAFDEAIGLANDLAAAPAVAVQAAKRAVRTADALSLPAALELERREFLATLASDDAREGLGAFLAKRPSAFTHR